MELYPLPEVDARYVDIGDLPTGFAPYEFKRLYVREFSVAELKLLYQGMHSRVRPIEHTFRAIQRCISVPVLDLTDGDLEFVMAWLRLHSYPKAPLQVSWTCRQYNYVYKDRNFYEGPPISPHEAKRLGLVEECCNTNNVNIVNKFGTRLHTLDSDDLHVEYDDLAMPTARTLSDFFELVEEEPHLRHMLECARWVKQGSTLKQKLSRLNKHPDMVMYENILECMKRYRCGVEDYMELKCRVCEYTWTHENTPKMLSFFADNTEEDIFKIQYSLMSEFGHQWDPDIPAKMLLFNYSSLAKDKQRAAEKRSGFKSMG